jgi:hypothetical protein
VPLVHAQGDGCGEHQFVRGNMAGPENVAQEASVYFRVQWIDPHPLGEDYPSEKVVLSIEPIGQPRVLFVTSPERYEPCHDAVTEAIKSQAVYWVQLDRSKMSNVSPHLNESTLDRLLDAIKNRQIVPSTGPE